ncbi:hypothetical protein AB0J82_25735 [Asanoa sp. NPDC049518]|uniref:hypothetical protein n=1 Tax=unclassified Asanoa TaxID=2685164 RepID=UPI00341A922D
MALIDLDREETTRRSARHPARTAAALGVLAALVVLPGEIPAPHGSKPVPECTVLLGNGPVEGNESIAHSAVIDPETGAVIFEVPPGEDFGVVLAVCPD